MQVTLQRSNYTEQLLQRLERVVAAAAAKVERHAKVSIQAGGKSGRIYKRGRRTHQASAPNEAPATDTGALVNSITSERIDRLTWGISVAAEYAIYLEMGTVRMAPRPFMGPALESVRRPFESAAARVAGGG